jgi:hypothetical protein
MKFTLQCERLTGGLIKILEVSEELKELNAKLEIKKISVAEKTAECEQFCAEIKEGKSLLRRCTHCTYTGRYALLPN